MLSTPSNATTLSAALCAAFAALAAPSAGRADTIPIEIVARGQNRITMDGILGDWRRFGELIAVDETAQIIMGQGAWSGAADASFGFAFARDEQALYFSAEVRDDTIVRTREHRANDDAMIFTLSVPGANNRATTFEVVAYPGDPGRYAGEVRFRGGRSGVVPGAQVVESPLRAGGGFTLEVRIPWTSLPGISTALATLRGRVAYQDTDVNANPSVQTILASGPGDAQHASALAPAAGTTGATAVDMVAEFQRTHELIGAAPFMDRGGNFAGDAALERIVVLPRYVLTMGPGIAGGSRYAFFEFPMTVREDVLDVTTRDVTGDGRLEVLMRLRVASSGLTREVLYVWGAPNGGDHLARLFAIELRRTQGGSDLGNRATYEAGGRIRVTLGTNTGFTQTNYPRLVEPGVLPTMTAWGPDRVVVYRWSESNQRFDPERTEPNPNAVVARGAAPLPPSTVSAPTMVEAPTDQAAVLRIFRTQRGLGESVRPNFTGQANVAGDATPESVHVFGRYLVVLGPRFMNGRSFYNVELPVNADADVLGLSFGDVTDDGHVEAIVRVRRAAQSQVRGQTLDVTREYVLAYSLEDAHRGRVFAAEVSRRVGNDSITNTVEPIRAGRNAEIVVNAGQARGWGQQNYPFHDIPQPGFSPILLPWEAQRRVTYRWNGTGFAAAP